MTPSGRTWGWVLLAVLVVTLVALIKGAMLGYIAWIYALMFALGIWVATPSRALMARLSWATALSVALVVFAAVTNALLAPGEEGGIVLGFITFGFYLGLPTLLFAAVMNVLLKRGLVR